MSGVRPKILDVFAGAGGLSLGFEAAGGRCIGAVEIDAAAAKTFASMFRADQPVVLGGPAMGTSTACQWSSFWAVFGISLTL